MPRRTLRDDMSDEEIDRLAFETEIPRDIQASCIRMLDTPVYQYLIHDPEFLKAEMTFLLEALGPMALLLPTEKLAQFFDGYTALVMVYIEDAMSIKEGSSNGS